MRRFAGLATAAAVVLTTVAATPAEARGRHGGWGHYHRDRVDAGDVIGGLLIVATIAAIANSANKDKPRRDREYRNDPPYRNDDPQYVPDDGRPANADAAPYGASEGEGRAADACSWAAEGEMGDGARVDKITGTEPRSGGWQVTGTASDAEGTVRTFDCRYRGGRVVDLTLD